MTVPNHIAENYKRFVDNGERTWEQIADQAHKDDAPALEKWARAQAAASAHTESSSDTDGADGEKPLEKLTVAELKERLAEFPDVDQKPFKVRQDYEDGLREAITARDAAQKREHEGDYADLDDAALLEYAIDAGAATSDDEASREELIERIKAAEAAGSEKSVDAAGSANQ